MIRNAKILAEIQARKQNILRKLRKVEMPEELKLVLAQLNKQDEKELIAPMANELLPNFSFEYFEREIHLKGFECYYEETVLSNTLEYCGAKYDAFESNVSKLSRGNRSQEVDTDFEAGAVLSGYLCSDCSYLNINVLNGPLYEIIGKEGHKYSEIGEEYEKGIILLENIYTLRQLEILHLSIRQLIQTKSIDYSRMKKPLGVFATNPGWDPFLIYFISPASIFTYEVGNQ